jgi:hypothetical protein
MFLTVKSDYFVRFQDLTVASMMFIVFWCVALCSHVEVYRHFRGAYCLHRQGNESSPSETLVNFIVSTQCCIPED